MVKDGSRGTPAAPDDAESFFSAGRERKYVPADPTTSPPATESAITKPREGRCVCASRAADRRFFALLMREEVSLPLNEVKSRRKLDSAAC